MKNFLLSAIFCSVIYTAFSQTNVGGTLSSNTTWTKANSPYVLTSTVGVPSSVTLIIEPGVNVSGKFDILVKGKIVAKGNATNYIMISNVRAHFKSCNLANSAFSFVKFNSGGVQLADESEASHDNPKNSDTLDISKCEFTNSAFCFSKGFETQAFLRVDSSYFNTANVYEYPRSEPIEINNSKIINSTIYSDSYSYGIKLNNCIVEDNTQLYVGCGDANIRINNSSVKDSKIISINGGSVNPALYIKNSIFQGTSININGTSVSILNSIFINPDYLIFGTGEINYSQFFATNASSSLVFGGYDCCNPNISVKNSSFTNSNTAIQIFDESYLFNATTITIDSCNFSNNRNFNIRNLSNKNIGAKYNYWGGTTTSYINDKIYDSYDDINKGEVIYTGSLNSLSSIPPIGAPTGLLKEDVSNGVLLKWNKNKESDIAGYKIYYGTFDGYKFSNSIDAGVDTSYLLSGKSVSDLVLVTAYDDLKDGYNDLFEGHESCYSNDALPVAKILDGDSVKICQDSKIVLHANKSDSYKYQWIKDGISISGAKNDSLEISNTGKYQVVETNINNISVTSGIVQVKVHQLTVQNSDISTVCGATLTLSPFIAYTGNNNIVYSWDADTTLSAANIRNPVVTITSSNTYRVSITDNVCSANVIIDVIVYPLTVNSGSDKSLVCGGTVQFDNPQTNYSGSGILNYSWFPETGLDNPKIARPTTELTSNAKFVLTVATLNGCIAKDSINIIVNPLTVTANDISVACGDFTNLNAVTNYSGTGTITYNWSPSTGLSATNIKNPFVDYNKDIQYSVEVITQNGCSASTVVNFNPQIISFDPSICMVTVNENDKNVIIWQRTVNSAIDTFYIYRESLSQTDKYEIVGKVPYATVGVFTDTTSNARVQSNKYKIATKDICGFVTMKSAEHKTMHLTINKGIGTNWNLIWEQYGGQSVSGYKIYRGTSKTNLTEIGSTSGGNTSYTDETATEGNLYYVVEVILPQACSDLKSSEYTSSRSNVIGTLESNGIKTNAVTESFFFPNPVDDKLYFKNICSPDASIIIYDLQGKIVLNQQFKSAQIDVSVLLRGIYTIKLIDSDKVSISKIVKR